MFPLPSEEIFAISGTITEIKDNSLIIEMPLLTEVVFPGEFSNPFTGSCSCSSGFTAFETDGETYSGGARHRTFICVRS